jgi:tRNA1(Val) A37 N6-methylase TrmN6
MSRITRNNDYVGRLRRSTGKFYNSIDVELDSGIQNSLGESRATPAGTENPSADDGETVRYQVTESTRETLEDRLLTAANDVLTVIDAELSEPLHDKVTEWCELHGFDTPTTTETRQTLARQAVLNLVLKTTLYEWHHQHGNLPPLPTNTREGLRQAAEHTDETAFNEYVLDEIVWLADDDTLAPIVDARDWLLETRHPSKALGRLYASLLSNDDRQLLGQFRTPLYIGTLMRTWAATGGKSVLDPGMGTGILSSPFHPQREHTTDPGHVAGIDRSRLSHLMGTTVLRLYGQAHESHATDLLDLSPDDLQQDVDAIVCNPPYTSGDSLPTAYKSQINAQIEDSTGLTISARSPLYAYFIYHARQFLSPGDRAAFITPQSFLSAAYGDALKQFLLDRFSIKALVQFNPEGQSVFSDADTTALIMFLEATSANDSGGETRFIRVDESVSVVELRNAVENTDQESINWGYINCEQQTQLDPRENWEALFTPPTIETSDLSRLGDFATVHRGQTTGNVNFFCLSQADVDDFELDTEFLSRLIRRPKLVDGYDFRDEDWETLRENGEDVWLLDPDALPEIPATYDEFSQQVAEDVSVLPDDDSGAVATLLAYLRDGTIEYDLQGTKVFKGRQYWYRPKRQEPPSVLIEYGSRDGFTFRLNETDARNINNFNGLYDVSVTETELKALLAYLNSGVAEPIIHDNTGPRNGGYEKLGIGDIKDLPVIDVTELNETMTTTLADLFDELRETARNDRDCERVRTRIDAVLKQLL